MYQRVIASMFRFLTAASGAPLLQKSYSAYRPSKLDDTITKATPAADAHGRTPNSRTVP